MGAYHHPEVATPEPAPSGALRAAQPGGWTPASGSKPARGPPIQPSIKQIRIPDLLAGKYPLSLHLPN